MVRRLVSPVILGVFMLTSGWRVSPPDNGVGGVWTSARAASSEVDSAQAHHARAAVNNPCSYSQIALHKCLAVFNATFLTEKDGRVRRYLWAAMKGDFTEAQPEDRKLADPAVQGDNCYASQFQHARTFVNKSARDMLLERLPASRVVVVGYMIFKEKCESSDVYYPETAGPLIPDPDGDDERQTFVLVAMHDNTAPAPLYAKVQVYHFYGNKKNRYMDPVGVPHDVIQCGNHTHPDDPWSDFWNCRADRLAQATATTWHGTLSDVRKLVHCESSTTPGCVSGDVLKARVTAFLASQSFVSPAARDAAVVALSGEARAIMAVQDPLTDPYWFSCAAGCCTAGT